MFRFSFTVGIAVAAIVISVVADEELYPSQYDNFDVDTIINDEVLRSKHYKCFYGSAECPSEAAKFFRDHLSEAFVTQCRKCTERQKELLDVMTTWYVQNSPKEWNDLVAKLIENAKKPSS